MAVGDSEDTSRAALERYDALIDVRSPGEFAEDHVPGAVNLPVLDDAERAEVGTIYVQRSKFLARRIGAAHVARNIGRHLETALADKPASFRPLIYCWRGGQRSNAMATILGQVGWPVTVLTGGYRTYRRRVTAALYGDGPAPRVVLLSGGTGTGKTDVLNRVAALGGQVLDLEALAEHRGSLFGGLPGRVQPSQKLFESRLLAALERLDPARPVLVEAESSKVGRLLLPPVLWRAMTDAPRIELTAPAEARARYLASAYAEVAADPQHVGALLAKLPAHISRAQRADWSALAYAGEVKALARALIHEHYDPAYARSGAAPATVIPLADLGTADRETAARAVLDAVTR